ncbi:hypothetical protein [Opitutus sp. ER46]|uniref:hypothetical protein n=1 Tax=Opitutus sp. ER46 TaxID=2161864 RepID=UPI000D32470F|nr:hypothetical protein [Opitutus sp. ER46]PTX91791.1 hypothetical protein DB354_18210 [Opitutus sp. ER46]
MKRLLPLLLLPASLFAATPSTDWAPNITGVVAWQGNVTNGGAVWDRISTLQLAFDYLATSRRELSTADAFHLSTHLGGEYFPRFNALARGTLGGRADWQHTFGTSALAPVFTAELAGDGAITGESDRNGFGGTVTFRVDQRFARGWRAALRERLDAYKAGDVVFDSRSHETAIEIGHDFSEDMRVTLTGRWRQGDVVTHAQYNRPDLAAVAHHQKLVDTFKDPMTAYAADARTIGARLAFIRAIAPDTALMLSYEYAQTKHRDVQFENQTIALTHIRQY